MREIRAPNNQGGIAASKFLHVLQFTPVCKAFNFACDVPLEGKCIANRCIACFCYKCHCSDAGSCISESELQRGADGFCVVLST